MTKLKILYLHNITEISGGERSLLNLWANLDRRRFELFLIVPQEGHLSRAARQLNVQVGILDVPKLRFLNIFRIFNCAIDLASFLRLYQIDIIHSYAPRNNILSALIAKLGGQKTIWHERNLLYGQEIDRSVQFFFLPDCIICNSNAVARRFASIKDSSKIRVVLNGVDLVTFKPSEHDSLKSKLGLDQKKVVGVVANLNKRKRPEFLIEAIPLVVSRFQDVRFLIIGGEFPSENGRRLKELQELVKSKGMENHVIFTGFKEDVSPYLNVLDLLVHVTDKEACSRSILEAMACGKAVIAVNDGGNPELVEDQKTGILTDVNDREKLVQSIAELLKDDHRRRAMGRQAREKAQQCFDVKRNAAQTQSIYLEISQFPADQP